MRVQACRLSRVLALGAMTLGSVAAFAQDVAYTAEPSTAKLLGGGILQLIIAIIQLCIALAIAAFAINKGLSLLTNLLNRTGKNLDIWQEIRNKNVAVALIGAAVVISYCNVIGSGIGSIANVLNAIARQSLWTSVTGLIAAFINLFVAIAVASFAITVVFRVMDKLTNKMDEVAELKANNIAVGAIYGGLIIGVSFLIAAGVSSIGMGVNAVLDAIVSMF